MPAFVFRQSDPLAQLRWNWALFLALGLVGISLFRAAVGVSWEQAAANRWALCACGVFILQMGLLWKQLPLNVTTQGRLAPSFGPGTWLSLVRLLALSMLSGFLVSTWPEHWLAWVPFSIYLAFNILDLADGAAARLSGTSTPLGAKIDIALDGAGVLVASLLAVHFGAVGWWYLLVGLARYAFLLGLWQRKRRGLPFEGIENPLRRPLAGVQMGITTALLAPGLPTTITNWVATITMIPFLANFTYDWLAGSGRITATAIEQARIRFRPAGNWVLLALRLGLGLLVGVKLLDAESAGGAFLWVELALTLGLLVGIWPRPLAFALLVESGLRLQGGALVPSDYLLLLIGLTLLYLGGGRFALRPGRDSWMLLRMGEKAE